MAENDTQALSSLRSIAALAKVPGWRIETTEIASLGAKAAASGAGRAARLAQAIQCLPADDAGEVLRAIEEVTRPMTAREIEKALSQTDLDYRARRAAVAALKGFNIVMVVPK
ncbi:hypothetical protein AAG614_03960 [Citromicrobium bathyomarinum]